MTGKFICFVNKTAYKTSKATEETNISGYWFNTGKSLYGRTKLISSNGVDTVWVESLDGMMTEAEYAAAMEPREVKVEFTTSTSKPVHYTVTRGDTVQSIAGKLGVSVSTVLNAVGSDTVAIGQVISINKR